ncbi:hypothetical protein HK097_009443 [Rhizophlyctis rosea]|uniref:Uncharacterized protein n=1 Tax=Rhizophlyctis rosea TaxID=64517 RepID=A0AAD5S8W9_9FUNG|nr:hypothetical protein HK097_009443 [Rhizophlyctis rosea]
MAAISSTDVMVLRLETEPVELVRFICFRARAAAWASAKMAESRAGRWVGEGIVRGVRISPQALRSLSLWVPKS